MTRLQEWLCLALCLFVAVAQSLSVVYSSRFSSMTTPAFKKKLNSLIGEDCERRLCLVPTASFAFNKDSERSRGEQRRRARYDAKTKAKEVAELLGLTDGEPM